MKSYFQGFWKIKLRKSDFQGAKEFLGPYFLKISMNFLKNFEGFKKVKAEFRGTYKLKINFRWVQKSKFLSMEPIEIWGNTKNWIKFQGIRKNKINEKMNFPDGGINFLIPIFIIFLMNDLCKFVYLKNNNV